MEIKVLVNTCAWCEPGFMPESSTSCTCVPVVPIVTEGQIYLTTDVVVGSTTNVVMNKDELVTFREWAVEGAFSWGINMNTDVSCLTMVGDPFQGTYYQQFTMRATAPDC
jgi:hypothetical protein